MQGLGGFFPHGQTARKSPSQRGISHTKKHESSAKNPLSGMPVATFPVERATRLG